MLFSKMFGVIVSVIVLLSVNDVVQGRFVYHPEIQRSVLHMKVVATWDEAKHRCESKGAVMASPLDEELLNYMKSSISETTPYFIGIKVSNHHEHEFLSLEGVLLEDLPEAAIHMIEKLDPHDGTCLSMDRRNIQTASCDSRLPYICYKNDTIIPVTTRVTDVTTAPRPEQSTDIGTKATKKDCSLGYTFLSGSYYKLHNKYSTWDDAQSTCASEGGYLAVPNNEQEAQTVRDFAFSNTNVPWTYIGVRKSETTDEWRSVLGDPLDQIYHLWATSRTNFHCGALKKDGGFDDMECSYVYPFICEKHC